MTFVPAAKVQPLAFGANEFSLQAATQLTATVLDATVTLTWTDNSQNESGYKIERKTGSGGFWKQIARETTPNQSSYAMPNTQSGTYFYRVRAYKGGVANGPYSNEASATVTSFALLAPTNLTATKNAHQIHLAWTDNSTGETGYKIERKIGSGGNWKQIFAGTTANQTSSTDANVTPGATYFYRVRSYKSGISNSPYSNTDSVTVDAALPAPSNLSATFDDFIGSVDLTWMDNSSGESGFEVQKQVENGVWMALEPVAANETTFYDGNTEFGTTYKYRVRALGSNGNSLFSNIASVTPQAAAPELIYDNQGYDQNARVSILFITLANSIYDGSNLYFRTSPDAPWTLAQDNVFAAGDETIIENLSYSTDYEFYLTFFTINSEGEKIESEPSEIVSVKTLSEPSIQLGSQTPSVSGVTLSWTKVNGQFYEGLLYRSVNGGEFEFVVSDRDENFETPDSFQYTDSFAGLAAGSTVTYYVANDDSPIKSNEVTVTVPGSQSYLGVPSNLTATAGSNRVNLFWTDNSTGETGFKVERKIGSGGSWSQIYAGTTANQTSYAATGLSAGVVHFFRVRAYRANVANGAYSNIASATPGGASLAAPSQFEAVYDARSDVVRLAWKDNSNGESGFEVQGANRAEEPSEELGDWKILTTTGPNQTWAEDGDVYRGVSYTYRVRAISASNKSPYSNVATVTTRPIGLSIELLGQIAEENGVSVELLINSEDVNYEVESVKLYYRTPGSDWVVDAMASASEDGSVISSTLNYDTEYEFYITYIGDGNFGTRIESQPSNIISARTQSSPPISAKKHSAPSGASS